MSACIEITAYRTRETGASADNDYTVSARLLTDELRQLIERQNIDCSDINSMKWPIFGMSRHATCKVLLLKSDLVSLMTLSDGQEYRARADEVETQRGFMQNAARLGSGQLVPPVNDQELYEHTEYRIHFRTKLFEPTHFSRMFLADIQPLMVSGFGDPNIGEALFIVTFKCFRWARRSMKFAASGGAPGAEVFDVHELNFGRNGIYPNSSKNEASRSVQAFFEFATAPRGIYASTWSPPGYHARKWEYHDALSLHAPWSLPANSFDRLNPIFGTPITDEIRYRASSDDPMWGEITTAKGMPIRLSNGRHLPYQALLDEVLSDTSSAVYAVQPSGYLGLPNNRGQYSHILMSLGSASGDFLNRVADSIIAGSIGGNLRERMNLNDVAKKYIVPGPISAQMAPPCGIYGVNPFPPNGLPPAVWYEYRGFENSRRYPTPLAGSDGPEWMRMNERARAGFIIPTDYGGDNALWNNHGFGEIISDFSRAQGPWAPQALSPEYLNEPSEPTRKQASKLMIRYQIASQNLADVWIRGWEMPSVDELCGWMQWIELRLQTDGKGFGFPTTRIWFDRNDPLVCPQVDDGGSKVTGLGLIKTWKGFDGKDRVCLDYPFGIPCLVMIIDNERITAGVDAWKYTCVFVKKGNQDDEQVIPPVTKLSEELYGGLEDPFVKEDDSDILNPQRLYDHQAVAYNLEESANSATFTAPGYKKPLSQPGFSVLPIGQDKDGNKHHVVVQGFIYRGGTDRRTCVYFSATNAIDGDCP